MKVTDLASSRIVTLLQGVELSLLGIYVFLLIINGPYQLYLSPRFIWLTFASALALMTLGVFNLFYPPPRVNIVSVVLFAFLLILCYAVPVIVLDGRR